MEKENSPSWPDSRRKTAEEPKSRRITVAEMKCNSCWKDIKGEAFITRCHHCFCDQCARKSFSQSMVPLIHSTTNRLDW